MTLPAWCESSAVTDFVNREVRLLNANDLDAWSALFDEDGYYFMPLHESMDDPEAYDSLIYDNRTLMAIRAEHARGGGLTQEGGMDAVRQVSDVHIIDSDAESCRVGATFTACIQWREQNWYAGRYRYELRHGPDGLRIHYKRVYLLGADRALGPIMTYL